MSTLKLSTLSNLAGSQSTAVENAINGSAKAWVNFNGTGTVAIRGSFNVSSITDGGTGTYTVNFITAMPNVNYSVVCSGHSTGFGRQSNAFAAWDGYSTTGVVIWTGNTINAAAEDLNTVNTTVFS